MAETAITAGHLLDGRVAHAQPASGHRTGIEPVLLAAAIPARPGESVVEAGCGSGAGLLCLAARVPGLTGLGIDIAASIADIAAANVAANGFNGLTIRAADIGSLESGPIHHHAFANPPWHGAAGTASADGARELARRAGPDIFAVWATRLARTLRHRGTLTFVVAAAALPACLAAFAAAGCGSPTILPLWPRAGVAAKLVLLQGIRGGRAAARLLPGLVLHTEEGSFTASANAVLRDGTALELR